MTDRSGNARAPQVGELKTVARQIYYEQLNFWLNPLAAVFTIVFSVVFLVLIASSAGHSKSSTLGGVSVIQYYVPGFLAYGIMSTCYNSLSIALVSRRESGLLKRLRLSPLPTWAFFTSVAMSTLIISVLQVVLLLVIGRFGYDVTLPHNMLALIVAIVVGAVSFTAIGIAMSTLVPNQEAAGPIVSIVFFILLFLSGLWYPISSTSELAKISSWFPIRHMIIAMYAPFDPRRNISGWSWSDILVIALWGIAGSVIALSRWSWAPLRTGPNQQPKMRFRSRASAARTRP